MELVEAMSLFDLELKEWVLSQTDIYHENHPLHWTVLEEIEEYEEALAEFDDVQDEGLPKRSGC